MGDIALVTLLIAAAIVAALVSIFIGICWASKQPYLWSWFNIIPIELDGSELESRILIRRIAMVLVFVVIGLLWSFLEFVF